MNSILLTGPTGDNPLGFLTALGTLRVLSEGANGRTLNPMLSWNEGRQPVLRLNVSCQNEDCLVSVVHGLLAREPSASKADTSMAKKAWELAKLALKNKRAEIGKRRLRGKEGSEARSKELQPLIQLSQQKRESYLLSLRETASDPTISIGKDLTASSRELTDHKSQSLEASTALMRRWPDIVAAFGTEDSNNPEKPMLATPLALGSASGHQEFLGTVENLMLCVETAHIHAALFGPWVPEDRKFSLRLDPLENRRYALMDRDPTASGNEALTMWGANRLAFEALSFFPCMPLKKGMAVAGWRGTQEAWVWRWPLWSVPCSVDTVQSLLNHADCWSDDAAARTRLRLMSCMTVITSRRIAVGSGNKVKYNLSPGIPVW